MGEERAFRGDAIIPMVLIMKIGAIAIIFGGNFINDRMRTDLS